VNNVHKAILEVMDEVGYVYKGGKMDFGNTKYSYAGEADLIKALRPVMVKAGLTLHCKAITPIETNDFNVTKAGYQGKPDTTTTNHRALMNYTFAMCHAESDTSIEIAAIGDGIDVGDKAAYKAATGALKYALRQTFIIETGDDPDKTASEEQAGEKIGNEDIKAIYANAAYMLIKDYQSKHTNTESEFIDGLLNKMSNKRFPSNADYKKLEEETGLKVQHYEGK